MGTTSNHRVLVASLLACGSGVAACGDDHSGDGEGDHHGEMGEEQLGPASGAECPLDSTLSYETFGRMFMEQYCVRCHSTELTGTARNGAPAGHDFNELARILPVADHIDQLAAAGPNSVNEGMPPDGSRPSLEERQMLGEWLACEMPAHD